MSISGRADELELVNLCDADWATCLSLLDIRNEDGVRNNMYNSHLISAEEHRNWIDKLRDDDLSKYFAVCYQGMVIGGVGAYAIDRHNFRADWAFYLTQSVRGKGLGAALEYKFLDYVFGVEGLTKLNCEVISWNKPVISLHKKFGFVQEGVRRNHIVKEGQSFDVVLLGIEANEWKLARENIAMSGQEERNTAYYLAIIDEIQEIRGKNNKNWMDLLRLSFRLAPKETAEIVAKIYEDDGAISALAKKLTE